MFFGGILPPLQPHPTGSEMNPNKVRGPFVSGFRFDFWRFVVRALCGSTDSTFRPLFPKGRVHTPPKITLTPKTLHLCPQVVHYLDLF